MENTRVKVRGVRGFVIVLPHDSPTVTVRGDGVAAQRCDGELLCVPEGDAAWERCLVLRVPAETSVALDDLDLVNVGALSGSVTAQQVAVLTIDHVHEGRFVVPPGGVLHISEVGRALTIELGERAEALVSRVGGGGANPRVRVIARAEATAALDCVDAALVELIATSEDAVVTIGAGWINTLRLGGDVTRDDVLALVEHASRLDG